MDAVKLEGGRERLDAIHHIVSAAYRLWDILALPRRACTSWRLSASGREAAAAQRLVEYALLCKTLAVSVSCSNRCPPAWRA